MHSCHYYNNANLSVQQARLDWANNGQTGLEKKLSTNNSCHWLNGIGLPVQKINGPIMDVVISTSIGLPVKNTIGSIMAS